MVQRQTKGSSGRGRASGRSPAHVMHQLKGIDFPASKKDLIAHAKGNKAPDEVLDTLQGFEERSYGNMADIMKAYGKTHH